MDIEQTIKEILAQQLTIDVNTIKLESLLMQDLNLDSFGAVELAFALEEKFNLKLSDDALYTAKTVQDIVSYISAQLSQK